MVVGGQGAMHADHFRSTWELSENFKSPLVHFLLHVMLKRTKMLLYLVYP